MEYTGLQSNRLFTVREWARNNPWPSESGLRHLIFRNIDGFRDKVIRKIGKRVLIHEGAFQQWINENGDAHNA